jgi:hypothetical protein
MRVDDSGSPSPSQPTRPPKVIRGQFGPALLSPRLALPLPRIHQPATPAANHRRLLLATMARKGTAAVKKTVKWVYSDDEDTKLPPPANSDEHDSKNRVQPAVRMTNFNYGPYSEMILTLHASS